MVTDARYEQAQYHELEWWTDNPIPMDEEWKHYLEYLGDFLEEVGHVGTCIDVGSGPIPFFCCPISCDRAIAVDPLIEEYAEIEWAQEQITRDFERVMDIHDVESAVSDLTLCLNTLDHAQSPYELLRQCVRVTKSGGHLVVTVDLDKPPDVYHPHMIRGPALVRALGRYCEQKISVVDQSWKFDNLVLWYAGQVR